MRIVLLFMAVFVGGAAGGLLREIASPALPAPFVWVPTFAINVTACFVIGWLYAVRDRVHEHVMHLAAVGFCGGLSTFSHFTQEVADLAARGAWAEALAYPALSVIVGIGAAVLGEWLGARRSDRRSA